MCVVLGLNWLKTQKQISYLVLHVVSIDPEKIPTLTDSQQSHSLYLIQFSKMPCVLIKQWYISHDFLLAIQILQMHFLLKVNRLSILQRFDSF